MCNNCKDDIIPISDDDYVTVTRMNNIIEVQYMEKENRGISILKLNKDEYLDIATGEIKEFEHMENRSQSENSLRQTFKKLRYLINNNFKGAKNELFVTLTYKENMKDVGMLYKDVEKFIKRLRYRFKDKTSIDYINVVEPQGRGAWHCHILFRFNDLDKVYIANSELRKVWGHGFVKIKSLEDVDNIGAYLSAYLTDIEAPDEVTSDNVDVLFRVFNVEHRDVKEVDGKKYIKGGRIHMYPAGMNIYRCSRGIKPPKRVKMRYKDIKKVVGSAKPHYSKTYKVGSKDFKNIISFIQYNLKR